MQHMPNFSKEANAPRKNLLRTALWDPRGARGDHHVAVSHVHRFGWNPRVHVVSRLPFFQQAYAPAGDGISVFDIAGASFDGARIFFQGMLSSGIEQIRRSIVGLAPDILGSIGELMVGLFIMFFVMYYGFRDGEGFIKRIRDLLPLEPALKESLFYEVRTITQAVLYGQVMTALIQGTLGGIGLLIFGISNWLFWGAIMIIMAFLPLLGTPLIWVPAAVSQILDGETARGVGLLIYGSTIVMNIDNVLRPRLMSGRTKVHPVLILVGVLGGLKIFGFIGMLVGPLILAVLVAFIKFYEQAYLHRKFTVGPAAD